MGELGWRAASETSASWVALRSAILEIGVPTPGT